MCSCAMNAVPVLPPMHTRALPVGLVSVTVPSDRGQRTWYHPSLKPTVHQGRILQFAGDGGFGYSVQELEVMRRLNLPVVSIIFNNSALGWIKHVQKNAFQENYISTDYSQVDFATVAKGFGVRSYTARNLEQVEEYMSLEGSPNGPAVIELISDQWETPVLGLK